MPHDDLSTLVHALEGVRPASAIFLHMAADALATEGVAATLLLHIPRNPEHPIEVEFVGLNPHPNRR